MLHDSNSLPSLISFAFICNMSSNEILFYVVLCIIYIAIGYSQNHKLKCFLKCMPIVWLIFCSKKFDNNQKAIQFTSLGLLFSCVGDAFLVWKEYFLFGMMSFGIAHSMFISSFGFENVSVVSLIPLAITGFILINILWSQLHGKSHIKRAHSTINLKSIGILKVAVPFYMILLMTMTWRGIDASFQKHSNNQYKSLIGGVLFAISDGILSLDIFKVVEFNQFTGNSLVMITYYASQIFIACVNDNN